MEIRKQLLLNNFEILFRVSGTVPNTRLSIEFARSRIEKMKTSKHPPLPHRTGRLSSVFITKTRNIQKAVSLANGQDLYVR